MDIKKIYTQIAKQRNISAAEAEREIHAAIDEAYKNPNALALAVPRVGEKPTPEEFIAHMAKLILSNDDMK